MRFLLDNNVSKKVHQLLISMGHEVTNLRYLNLEFLKNGEVYAKACDLDRVLVTYDDDFINIGRLDNPSIIYVKVEKRIDEYVIPRIKYLIENIDLTFEKDYLIILENSTETFEKFTRRY